MKISGASTSSIGIAPQAGSAAVADVAAASAAPAPVAAAGAAVLESAVLQPAQRALRAMPDFDAAKVAELRDALANGELPFDAGRLAGLIQKFHGAGKA
ncbi:flagellar biosynthesis anti-sigma factor FlgM [Massilia sp. 9096]|uniref:flagellar biosynthesis anti-sigma factor FlgM n=1 Tax=Massilia sp. 9096 TaxID=1500894 RepID=UPI000564EE1A|nr:flagellar biosynthesis anti-sigma factor FlgM [Massilia sp. 9096]